jgi:hypothetical protein
MMKLCIFVGTTAGGLASGLLAGALDLDTFSLGGFALSGVGSLVGVYGGGTLARKLAE